MPVHVEHHSGWAANQDAAGGYDIVDRDGWALARVNYDYAHTCNGTNHHRAHLIAAAPELAEALDSLLMAINLPGNNCEVEQATRHAKAALAKARGET
jgi:hypothetical protein